MSQSVLHRSTKAEQSFPLLEMTNNYIPITSCTGYAYVYVCVYCEEAHTTLAPMLVCPLPSQGMDAETGICGGAKGTELDCAMLV